MKRLVVLLVVALGLAACGEPQKPAAGPSPSAEPTRHPNIDLMEADSRKPRFDGTIYGWRVAPTSVLEREGLRRDLREGLRKVDPDCEARRVRTGTRTDLDFTLTYFPQGVKVAGKPGVDKWVCGDIGLSVLESYSFDETPHLGVGDLRVERVLRDKRAFDIHAAEDRVEACSVRGFPAVCVHAVDDETGLGESGVVVIEDDDLDPFATTLLVWASELPFDEVLKVAEGVR